MSTTRIDLIRHGEPEGGNVFRGRTDHALTELGRWQFAERVRRFDSRWTRIISSPLSRCHSAAEQLASARNLPLACDERWAEIDYGDWENRDVSEVMAEYADDSRRLWADPLNFCAPNGEPVPQLQQRVGAAWQELLQDHRGEHLLLVSHGGVMRVLAQQLLSLAPEAMNRLAIPYAGLLRFKIDHSEYQGKEQVWVSLEGMDGSVLHPDDQEAV
ncbi:histidine phosphatase family protein [Thalassolituus hydrocarboniclasticus]|uniref:Histidine phosphatase family protein n=1 Tax=Thalassolituus hydrocarboniclasticus TaxID=2742796 RepID=A0ABY6ACG7_9GAMM|nr:histidine phosphatase family protein [Thalassolituus hydrocarboniclasticus]UXD88437.1 histidine phosphatase family protein [Thalassolituus hydrocarboniclasticus]